MMEMKQEKKIVSDGLFQFALPEQIQNQSTGKNLSVWQDVKRLLVKNKPAMIGIFCIVVMAVISILAPILSQYSYSNQNLSMVNAGPSSEHWFGTDSLGRDLWVRIWYGVRVSLAVGVFGSILPSVIGIMIGGISGYFGGIIDMFIMRFVDILVCIPNIIYVILISLYLGSGPIPLIFTFSITGWMGAARNVRGLVLQLRESEYVIASRILGASHLSLIFKHIIPNTLGVMVISVTMGIPNAIFQEAYLSFIGLGIQPPIPSLGQLANFGISVIKVYPLQLLIPAIFISLIMLSFNLFGDGIRDALDPKLRNE